MLLPVGDHMASTAICYEVIYPDLIRRFVRDGSELLTTITNDAWYGRSSAAYQHWEQASMRAIEEGRYLARAANTGISGFVDPYGRVIAKTPLFEQAIVVQDVRFLTDRTIYSRIGDLVAWLSLALTLRLSRGVETSIDYSRGLAGRIRMRDPWARDDSRPTTESVARLQANWL